jgi:general secretion pathway protein G
MKITNATENCARRNPRAAFTLVEMLLVVVILGILASIVLPRISGNTERARKAAAQTEISAFGTALGAFEVDNGYYPRGRDGLQALRLKPRDAQNWHGPYMEQDIPPDPWGKPYVYECPGKHNPTGYDVSATALDGTVIGNWTTTAR